MLFANLAAMGRRGVVLIAFLGLALSAAAAALPSCRGFTDWTFPKACPFKACVDDKTDGAVFDLANCAFCDTIDDGTRMADMISCNVCKKGWVNLGDRYRQECLSLQALQCRSWAGDGCGTCARGAARVLATMGPAMYFRASKGFCPDTWNAAGVCRTCAQLGCPRACAAGAGCRRCPRGSVRLHTTPPLGLRAGQWHGYCTGLRPAPFEPVPKLPAVCLRAKEDLRCAPGKAMDGVGCTACPAGLRRRPIAVAGVAGSSFWKLQPEGFGCY